MAMFHKWLYTIRTSDSDALRRGKLSLTIILLLGAAALLTAPLALLQSNPAAGLVNTFASIVVAIGLAALIRAGRVDLGALLLTGLIIVASLAPVYQPGASPLSAFFLLISIITAGLILRPVYVWLVLVLALIGLGHAAFIGAMPLIADPDRTFLVSNIAVLLVNSALLSFLGARATTSALRVAETAQELAEHHAVALAQANNTLETRVAERTAELQTALANLETRAREQARLLEEIDQHQQVIREMSVPILPVDNKTLAMPLVGALDSSRLRSLQEQALTALERTRARRILLDVTGVPVIDTLVGQELIRLVEAARLLGTEVVLIGVRPEVAETIVTLGMNLSSVQTAADLQSAIRAG